MESYRGTRALQSFSPAWADPEILEKTLIGRKPLVDRLEELAIDGAGGPNKHQRLIVGVRGSGKTHVLRALRNRLWRNEEIKKRLLIIYLLEDELGVASFLDFVIRLLNAIIRWHPEREKLTRDVDALFDLPLDLQEDRAVQLLLAAIGEGDALILMENLGLIFDERKGFGLRGQQALRDLVQKHPRFMIFATSQALVEGTRNPDAPFYGFFKIIHLQRLSVNDALRFLEVMASISGKKDVVHFLNSPKGRARMRAIYDFTGGNHRLLVNFYEFITADAKSRLSELFLQALNPLKPYYQEQMRSLSAQQQKIIQYLAIERQPRIVKDIARGCLAAQNTISSQMKDLLDRNFVSRIEQGRQSYYEITETLFRICYEADLEQEGAPVKLFIDFLTNLYSGQELHLQMRGFRFLAEKLGNEGAVPFMNEAKLYAWAIEQRYPEMLSKIQSSHEIRIEPKLQLQSLLQEMEQEGAYREILDLSQYLGEEKDDFVMRIEASAYAHLGDSDRAKETAMQVLEKNPQDVEALLILAEVLTHNHETCEAGLDYIGRVRRLMPDDPQIMARIGKCLLQSGKLADALKYIETLTQEYSDFAEGWILKARILEGLERKEEAQNVYWRALELDPKNSNALRNLGILIGNTGKHEEALALFRTLNEVAPDDPNGWWLTGNALRNLGREKEAVPLYRKALELDPGNAGALKNLGVLVGQADKHEEALGLFQRLNETAPDHADGWRLTGTALHALGREEEAQRLYRRSLELDPGNSYALKNLGALINNTGQHEEALGLFRQLNEAAPDDADGWQLTGQVLQVLGREKEAILSYRKALELNPSNRDALMNLSLLMGRAGEYEEALRLSQKLNEIAPDYSDGWILMGQALQALRREEEAEPLFRKALELDPDNGEALKRLGMMLGNAGEHEEALKLFQRFNESIPDSVDGWLLAAQALLNVGRGEEAESLYRKVLELNPRNAVALMNIGIIDGSHERYEEALELFHQLNKVAPGNANGWWLTGLALINLGREKEAELMFRKALEIDPQNEHSLKLLGTLYLPTAGRREEALELFRRLNNVAPDDSIGWLLTSMSLHEVGREEEAEALCRKALELNPENEKVWALLSGILATLGRDPDASMAFNKALALGADHGDLLNSRGEARRRRGEYEASIIDYENALQVDSKAILPHFNMVSALLAMGRIQDALRQLPIAIEADKASETPKRGPIIQSFQESCYELFEHAPTRVFTSYLEPALEIIEKMGYLEHFEESLPLTVLSILKDYEKISEARFQHIMKAFEDVIGKRIQIGISIRYLQVGIDYFKKRDHKSLLSLTREERSMFCEQLGIENY